ncbi:hypothetical protein, partial [Plasmodium yoelii yoelii]
MFCNLLLLFLVILIKLKNLLKFYDFQHFE